MSRMSLSFSELKNAHNKYRYKYNIYIYIYCGPKTPFPIKILNDINDIHDIDDNVFLGLYAAVHLKNVLKGVEESASLIFLKTIIEICLPECFLLPTFAPTLKERCINMLIISALYNKQ